MANFGAEQAENRAMGVPGGPGLIVLFGSGETSASGRKVNDWLLSQMRTPVRIAVLETPAGFEPNSASVAGRIAEFYRRKLQAYCPRVDVIPARKRGSPFSPDDPETVRPLLSSDAIFIGPGSPTYAVRQLLHSLAWYYVLARNQQGAAVILASAAAVAAGSLVLPVYEIFKVGEELHWKSGLDLFGLCGLSLAFVPHWNNDEGGQELDTSRCFMGQVRFARLIEMAPAGTTVVGIDEHTALVVDPRLGTCRVLGKGTVTVLAGGTERCFKSGQGFSAGLLGEFRPVVPGRGLPANVWAEAQSSSSLPLMAEEPPAEVLDAAREREAARSQGDWRTADSMREKIVEMGWQVSDTADGTRLMRPCEADG